MSEITATGYRDRILGYAAEHGHEVGTSKAMRLAVKLCKRQARMTDLELERILTHSDPTPRDAIRNIERSTAA
jgi:hypothetical protein